ncbi:MAG: hypothetical protein ACRDIB_05140, partial [Ardenticatenaceae bacterium]
MRDCDRLNTDPIAGRDKSGPYTLIIGASLSPQPPSLIPQRYTPRLRNRDCPLSFKHRQPGPARMRTIRFFRSVFISMKEVRVLPSDRAGRDAGPSIRPVLIYGLLAVVALSLLAVGVLVAWSSLGDDDEPDRDGPLVSVATFTPAPPDFTPEVARTFVARQTAAAQTATAQPEQTAAPDGTVDPDPDTCI